MNLMILDMQYVFLIRNSQENNYRLLHNAGYPHCAVVKYMKSGE